MKDKIYEESKKWICKNYQIEESVVVGPTGVFGELDQFEILVLDLIDSLEAELHMRFVIDYDKPIGENMNLAEFSEYLSQNTVSENEYWEIQRGMWKKENRCVHCGGNFKKTLFSIKCMECGQKKDY